MPIYEYACKKCGHEFEQLVRGDEKVACPACDSKQLQKKFSVPAAHTGDNAPSCSVPETGACDPDSCCGGGCNLDGMM